ncbi:magnesium chelatase subunit D [Congregibacter litoralis]|uniref:Protoporphyrin IX magnesium-chelatase n=1 Tax=Congregibacter litoralis KT71 TaxID=314285 RepID=A4ACS0_9GAMM|nr:magnesium chelatase subunit D [Congregibacter litoralis]EAQ96284.1 protoporphyrin IX magnesium-chelatase [Congregibacter litoralis KT71]
MTIAASDEQLARWNDAAWAAACLAVGGHSLGGVRLKGRPGPVRDFWLEQCQALLPDATPWRKIPLHCSESRLLGGLDLAATLRKGSPVAGRGLLVESSDGVVLLSMAERAPTSVVAPLAALLDEPVLRLEREGIAAQHDCRLAVIALDEGVDDEALAANLIERLALQIDLTPLPVGAIDEFPWSREDIQGAREALAEVELGDQALQSICQATLALGIDSPRAALLAARTARVLTALAREESVSDEQLEQVVRLVLLPLATRLPGGDEQDAEDDVEESPDDSADDSQPPDNETPDAPDSPPPSDAQRESEDDKAPDAEQPNTDPDPLTDDRLLEAAQAMLPPDLLAKLLSGSMGARRNAASGKSGARQRAKMRGRPMGSLPGDPRSGARLDVMATLRTAAPWQRLRGPATGGARLRVQAEDFRIVRFRQRSQSVTVFVVDASGSSALYRLAEAKGAVELLLADCYVRRDEVALIAFRGDSAELLLPPTRSLVRAKRSLSALPGGGGTPLAAGIDATAELLEMLDRRGATPAYVMLTDGRGNVCRDGSTGREPALADALLAAQNLRLSSAAAGMVIDTSPRPHRSAAELAENLGALYLPLPNADARQLQSVVRQVVS